MQTAGIDYDNGKSFEDNFTQYLDDYRAPSFDKTYIARSVESEIPSFGKITPYPFQWDIIEDVKEYIRTESEAAKKKGFFDPKYIEAYVSAGKTIIIGALASHIESVSKKFYKKNGIKLKALVLTTTAELVQQNSDECWNMGEVKNSVYCNGISEKKSAYYDIVVGSVQSIIGAIKDPDNTDFDGFYPYIFIDECHEVDWREVLKLKDDPKYDTKNQYARVLNHFYSKYSRTAVIGLTGTPYRGVESINGPYWKGRLGPRIDRDYLVNNGYIVPTIFGIPENEYDLSEFDSDIKQEGTEDLSSSQLEMMHHKMDVRTTGKIMAEVVEQTKDRLGVLITCANRKHCEEAAASLPEGQWAIVDGTTEKSERSSILARAKEGKIKFILQIGCLTTGVNVPFWDTSVILRRIGSLTLLTQLLGRGMRLLKSEHEGYGWVKTNHLVLDFSGTMEAMQKLFDDPILSEASLERAKQKKGDTKECPHGHVNSFHAKRCSHAHNDGTRCEHFWSFIECPHNSCDGISFGAMGKRVRVKNVPSAVFCRCCGGELKDPNDSLNKKHYTRSDWKAVKDMKIGISKAGGIYVIVEFDLYDENGQREVAKLHFYPFSSKNPNGAWQAFRAKFINTFIHPDKRYSVLKQKNTKSVEKVFEAASKAIKTPVMATHRVVNGQSNIYAVDFGDVKIKDGKQVDDLKVC